MLRNEHRSLVTSLLLAVLLLSACQPVQPLPAAQDDLRQVSGAIYLPSVPEWGGVAVSFDMAFQEVNPETHEATGYLNWRNFQPQPPAGEPNWKAVNSDVRYVFFGADEAGGDPNVVVVITQIRSKDGWGQGEPGEYAYFWFRDGGENAKDQWGMRYFSFDPWYEFYPAGEPPVEAGYFTAEEMSADDPVLPLTVEVGDFALQGMLPATQGYAHPEALASTEWLAKHLDDPDIRILDGREPPDDAEPPSQVDYAAGHIPGAVYVDLWSDLGDPNGAVPALILPPAEFEALMGRLGIDNDSTVVIYDDTGGAWAARVWWALRYYGHDQVKLLNGGLKKWVAEGRPLEKGANTPAPASFVAQPRPELLSDLEDVKQAIEDPAVVLVDALPAEVYSGAIAIMEPRAGHIPTALNLPAPDNLNPVDDTLLPAGELARLWAPLGIEPAQRVITYCGAGYYGALDLFALYQLGHEDFSLYDASWFEWGSNPDLPVETGADPVK